MFFSVTRNITSFNRIKQNIVTYNFFENNQSATYTSYCPRKCQVWLCLNYRDIYLSCFGHNSVTKQ